MKNNKTINMNKKKNAKMNKRQKIQKWKVR